MLVTPPQSIQEKVEFTKKKKNKKPNNLKKQPSGVDFQVTSD